MIANCVHLSCNVKYTGLTEGTQCNKGTLFINENENWSTFMDDSILSEDTRDIFPSSILVLSRSIHAAIYQCDFLNTICTHAATHHTPAFHASLPGLLPHSGTPGQVHDKNAVPYNVCLLLIWIIFLFFSKVKYCSFVSKIPSKGILS